MISEQVIYGILCTEVINGFYHKINFYFLLYSILKTVKSESKNKNVHNVKNQLERMLTQAIRSYKNAHS